MRSSQEIFEFGRITASQQWLAVGLLALLAAVLVLGLYRRDLRGLRGPIAFVLASLRLAVLALVGWTALDPRTIVETTITHPPRLAVLLDRSRSMATPDVVQGPSAKDRKTRWKLLRETLGASSPSAEWGRERDLQFFTFGSELRPVDGVEGLDDATFDDETKLGSALIQVLGAKDRRPPAAVIVASDGGLNAGATVDEAVAAATSARVPIHSIVFGAEKPLPNIRVVDVRLPPRVSRGSDEATGSATIETTGGVEGSLDVIVEAKRLDRPGVSVALGKRAVAVSTKQPTATVPILLPAREAGRWEVTARVDVRPGELPDDDNRASAVVEVVDRKTKVLLIAGSSTREFQFLRGVLFRDKNIELSIWLQPGRAGVSQDAQKVLDKFPASREDLFAYDVLVAIDSDWRMIDDQGSQALAQWVSSQAGGVILVAGAAHWLKLDPAAPVMALSPVVQRRQVLESSNAASTELRPLVFTRDGESNRMLALADDLAQSKKLWSEFAGVFWSAPVERLKPGATLLVETRDPHRGSPASEGVPFLASQFFGSGRVIYVGSGELWRLRRNDERLYERLWTQLVRDVGEGRLLQGSRRGRFLVDQRELPLGQDLPIRAFVLDERYQPLRTAKITATATTSQGTKDVSLEPVTGQPGRYQGLLAAPAAGVVRVQLPLPGGGILDESFTVRASKSETDDVQVRRDILERLAAATGGKVTSADKVDELTALLPNKAETTVLTSPPNPLWDRPWLVYVLVGLLGTEWVVRKLNRLA